MDISILTAIDANINRCMEGLRVCEDLLRFTYSKGEYSVELKRLRHELKDAAEVFPRGALLSARDVEGDSQKFYDLPSEMKRAGAADIFSSNIHRAIEAARSLEELSKLHSVRASSSFQSIRFGLYSLEKSAWPEISKISRLDKFNRSLYAILDSAFIKDGDYAGAARFFIRGGASVIQLRMKNSSKREVLKTAQEISEICTRGGAIFIINDHADIALISGADGLHLGQDDIPVEEARKILPADSIIGKSTHSYEQAKQAALENPDYIAIGPIFDTATKSGVQIKGIGMDVISGIRLITDLPIVAIGGIGIGRASDVIKHGADSIAVISALYDENRLEENSRQLLEIIRS